MGATPSGKAFVSAVTQSGLVDADEFGSLVRRLKREGVPIDDPAGLANALVERGTLTRWQADKLLEGKRRGFILGKYRLLSLIGKGGMSSVYLAEHVLMHRRCAIKVLPAKFVHDRSYLGRFHREAQAVASLDHLNIVRAYDVDKQVEKDAEIHFLVMEYVEGRSLQDLVLAKGPLEYVSAADYVRQAADGLAHAHESGIVHRDVKPGNLLVDRAGVVKILDLGLARFFRDDEKTSLTVAHHERMLGTADYLAPEQALDSHNAGAPADIYSLGCTFYYLLSGRPPFDHGSLTRRLISHQSKSPPPLETLRQDVPAALVGIISRMTAKKPEQRYPSAADVALALTDWLLDHAGAKWKLQHPALAARRAGSTAASPPADTPPSKETAKTTGAGDDVRRPKPSRSDSKSPQRGRTAGQRKPKPGSAADEGKAAKSGGLTNFIANLDSEDAGKSAPAAKNSPAQRPSSRTRLDSQPDKNTASQRSSSGPALPPDAHTGEESPEQTAADGSLSGSGDVPHRPEGKHRPNKKQRPAALERDGTGEPRQTADRPPAPSARRTARSRRRASGVHAPGRSPSRLPPPSSTRRTGRNARNAAALRSVLATLRSRLSTPAGIVVSTFLVSCLTAALLFGMLRRGANDVAPPAGSGTLASDERAPLPKPQAQPPAWVKTGELMVGPGEEFASVQAAVDSVKEHFSPFSPRDRFTIKVAGGTTYRERIVLDNSDFSYPKGMAIVCDGPEPAVIAPGGDEPVLTLIGMERLTLDGFHIDAASKPVAIKLSGYLLNTILRRLTISGFEQAGIQGEGPAGMSGSSDQVFFEQLVFKAANPQADGMVFRETSTHRPSNLTLAGCRFFGPLTAGISFHGHVTDVVVRESLFANVADALSFHSFQGEAPELRGVTIENNSFFEVKRGVAFREMPSNSSDSLVVRRNLFMNTDAEGLIERRFEQRAFLAMFAGSGIADNWTNRPPPSEPFAGEAPFFGNGGRRGASFQFESTNPADHGFLRPTSDAPHRSIGAIVRN